MCDDKENRFICSWKIRNMIQFFEFYDFITLSFEAQGLGDSKWIMKLHNRKAHEGTNNPLKIQLLLKDYDENLISGKLDLNLQYKLLSPDGEFSFTSEIINTAFERETISEPYRLMAIEDLEKKVYNWSEDTLTIICYMANTNNKLTLLVSETQTMDCEAESRFPTELAFLQCCFQFTDFREWSVSKRLDSLSIPVEITFSYVAHEIQVLISSNIEDDTEFCIYSRVDFKDANGSIVISKDKKFTRTKNDKIWRFDSFIYSQHIEKAKCFINKKVWVAGSIFLVKKFTVISYSKMNKNREVDHVAKLDSVCLSSLQKDLQSLLEDKHFSDVKLRADKEIFLAHKSLLAARSPVFSAMFHHDMAENNTGIVDILDVESKYLKSFLEFIYTGEIRNIDEGSASAMLIMSDKYEVVSLEKKSSAFLMSVMSENNVCKILSIADMVNCKDLKSFAEEYIVEHSKKVLSSSEWSKWTKNNITLATEIILKLSNKLQIKS